MVKKKLSEQECIPCSAGAADINPQKAQELLNQLQSNWVVNVDNHIEITLEFRNFKAALECCNEIGVLAEEVGHHPDMRIGWGYLNIELWTHKTNSITESDLVFAAKVDSLIINNEKIKR